MGEQLEFAFSLIRELHQMKMGQIEKGYETRDGEYPDVMGRMHARDALENETLALQKKAVQLYGEPGTSIPVPEHSSFRR